MAASALQSASHPAATGDAEAQLTPVMRQYFAAKQAHPDCLMFCRIGDFYELFYEDAITVARELQLTLTARDREKKQPMCGVPYHAAEVYLQRLLRKGYRIALCEQMEDPKTVKGIVKREVTRVLTPGTHADPGLGAGESCWLAAINAEKPGCVGLALIDLSTGDFRATEFSGPSAWPQAVDELNRVRPVELVHAQGGLGFTQPTQGKLSGETMDAEASGLEAIRTRTPIEDWVMTAEHAVPLLRRQLRVLTLEGLGLAGHEAAAIAAGALVHYLRQTKQGALEHLELVRFYECSDSLELDAVSVRNLELVDPLFSSESAQNTLLYTLDACCTPMGKRLLRANLLRPSRSLAEIDARLASVAEAAADLRRREGVRRAMDGLLDLERLLGRVALDSAGPREVLALAAAVACLPGLRTAVLALAAARWQTLAGMAADGQAGFDSLEDLHELIATTIVEAPPVTFAEGGVIRAGIHAELDELRELSRNGRAALVAIEERERQRTGITSLKVRYNTVFGYYLEITKANLRAVPADYERKQTLVNAERFTTPELKDYEANILNAQEHSLEIERRLFAELRTQLLAGAARIRETARRVAEIDLLAAFAHLAALCGWTRPQVDESGVLEFIGARHPVVERRLEESGSGRFIPNSLHLEAGAETDAEAGVAPSLLLVTGPNMGGKSTYLRMSALLVIMAQMGSFVPAERMRLGLVDRIFTRIGASDNVARGRSTFMVEMTETAAILNTATARSLVLMDEMGRGTATYDGLSLAWATVEHMHDRVRARTLFATHYHELTLLADKLRRLRNVRVTAKESAGGIVFLHTVEAGAASKSYGIEVARLAGFSGPVIARARDVLKLHERAETQQMRDAAHITRDKPKQLQMTMFTPLSQKIIDRLEALEVDKLTPLEALNLLAELKRELNA